MKSLSTPLADCIVSKSCTLRDLMKVLTDNAAGIALIVDDGPILLRTVTDGDIRRAILDGISLDIPVAETPLKQGFGKSLTAQYGVSETGLLDLMTKNHVRHVPLVNSQGIVVKLVRLEELVIDEDLPITAVVMAGGSGQRLRPLTDSIPKPMLPVGDSPLLHHIVSQLQRAGIRNLTFTTHYMSQVITDYFKDGTDIGVNIKYIHENEPLGTAGALRYVEGSDDPVLVMNGDILTRLDFRAMLEFHQEHNAQATMAIREYTFEIPYGVVETEGADLTSIVEKPVFRRFVNAGIYLINANHFSSIPPDVRFDMPQFLESIRESGGRIITFPIHEYWLDIGQRSDYDRAVNDMVSGQKS